MLTLSTTTLRSLPRDARDTLFLLAVIAWVVMPQVPQLPWWCSALAGGVLLWRGQLALRARPLPSKWWLASLLAVAVLATLATYRTVLGREAGVTLIVILLALKTLELRARRDAFVVFFLGFFTMLTNFFSSQSLLTAAGMLVALMGLLTALVNAHSPVGKPPLMRAARTAGWMTLLGAPVMVLLFVLFPRLAPLWGIPADAATGRSGLSASMQVGNIAKLALDETIALRIKFDGPAPSQTDMYFRGPVLSTFDGRQWLPLQPTFLPSPSFQTNLQVSGRAIKYEVTQEPTSRPWLMVLDAAATTPALPGYELRMTRDLQWLASRPVTELVRYRAESHTSFQHGPRTRAVQLQDYIALPPGFNPRTLALAAEIRRDPRYAQADAAALVPAVMERLRTGGYSYTLEPGVYGPNSADEFWFDRKEGFCEHIASAFVVLMRALDVPARIVTGYQGGERNNVDGYWVLRQSDAHAWTEVWQEGVGWQRVDPTGAVAPGRVALFQRLAAPQGIVAGAVGAINPDLLVRLRSTWEAMNNGWNQWVLNYSQSRQLDLLKNLGFQSPSWEDLAYLLLGVLVATSLGGAAWTLWERLQHDPWLRLLERVRKRLRAAGVALPDHAAPRQMASAVAQHFGNDSLALQDWLLRLEAQRYAPQKGPRSSSNTALSLSSLQREWSGLPWPNRLPGPLSDRP